MGFRFRKNFRIAPGLTYSVGTGGGGRRPAAKAGLIPSIVAVVIVAALLRACFGRGEDPVQKIVTPAPISAEARLAELERKKVEAQQWAEAVARFNAQFSPVVGEIGAAAKGATVSGGWDDTAKRAVVRAVWPGGDADAFLNVACERVHAGGFDAVEGAWVRVEVEVPPAKKSKPGEKWGSVSDAVNSVRVWKGCPGAADIAPEFWRTIAAMPGFVDLYGGRPQLSADVVQIVERASGEEERLRLVVGVCKAAKAAGLAVGHVRLHSAPAVPDKVHWKGTLHQC